nr:hypothetical protein [Tanacetum cinerariifolium]
MITTFDFAPCSFHQSYFLGLPACYLAVYEVWGVSSGCRVAGEGTEEMNSGGASLMITTFDFAPCSFHQSYFLGLPACYLAVYEVWGVSSGCRVAGEGTEEMNSGRA